jgi:hypothetical protein
LSDPLLFFLQFLVEQGITDFLRLPVRHPSFKKSSIIARLVEELAPVYFYNTGGDFLQEYAIMGYK